MKDKELKMALTKDASVEKVQNILTKYPTAVKSVNKFNKRLALHWACINEVPLAVVRLLIEEYPQAVAQTDKQGMTPLHYACASGTAPQEMTKLLVDKCPETIQKTDDFGCTPLHLACRNRNSFESIDFLVQNCPEAVPIRNKEGLTSLELACTRVATEWASPEDRASVLELLRTREKEILEKEAERQREEKERLAREAAAEKKKREEEEEVERIKIIQQKEAEEEERKLKEQREKEAEEEERQQPLIEQHEKVEAEELDNSEEDENRQHQERTENSYRSTPQDDEYCNENPQLATEVEQHLQRLEGERNLNTKNQPKYSEQRVAEEEKKSEDLGPRPLPLRNQPPPDQVAECFRPVALKPRLEPPPGLVILNPAGAARQRDSAQNQQQNILRQRPQNKWQERNGAFIAQKRTELLSKQRKTMPSKGKPNESSVLGRPEADRVQPDRNAALIAQKETELLAKQQKPMPSEVKPSDSNVLAPFEADHGEATSKMEARNMTPSPALLDSPQPIEALKGITQKLVENDNEILGAQNNYEAHKDVLQTDGQFTKSPSPEIDNLLGKAGECRSSVPVTPEPKTLFDQEHHQQQPLLLSEEFRKETGVLETRSRTDIPPGFDNHANIWNSQKECKKTTEYDMRGTTTAEACEEWQPIGSADIDSFCLFPDVNLQSLAESLGYNRPFEFGISGLEIDNDCDSPHFGLPVHRSGEPSCHRPPDKTLQRLTGELLSHPEESIRLRDDQQMKWRREMKNNDERTPLHLACAQNNPCKETIRLLANTWPSHLEKQDKDGLTPLHAACAYNAPLDVIEMLVSKFAGAVHMADRLGNTPIHIACEKRCPHKVILLLAEKLSESPS